MWEYYGSGNDHRPTAVHSRDVLTPHAIYPYPYQTKKAPKMTMKKKSTAKTRRINARLPLYLFIARSNWSRPGAG